MSTIYPNWLTFFTQLFFLFSFFRGFWTFLDLLVQFIFIYFYLFYFQFSLFWSPLFLDARPTLFGYKDLVARVCRRF
jgi:hypothetical protein